MKPDVAIVGGGIIGACAALELARAGLRVVVVEKTGVGLGSTAASSACIRQGFGRAEAIDLARDGLARVGILGRNTPKSRGASLLRDFTTAACSTSVRGQRRYVRKPS